MPPKATNNNSSGNRLDNLLETLDAILHYESDQLVERANQVQTKNWSDSEHQTKALSEFATSSNLQMQAAESLCSELSNYRICVDSIYNAVDELEELVMEMDEWSRELCVKHRRSMR